MSAGLETTLGRMEALAGTRRRPDHHLAREVLLALGAALRDGSAGTGSAEPWLRRARAAGEALGPDWRRAVQAELSMACGEVVQGLDPRFVELPNYDLEYSRSARERLESRLLAAAELGFALETREQEMLALADRMLAALVARRSGPGGGPEGPGRAGTESES